MLPQVVDRYHMNYIVFYMIGICTHISKNFFITATNYWLYKFRNTSIPEENINSASGRTDLQAEFIAYFSVISNVVTYVFVALTIFFGRRFSLEKQITGTIFILLACFISTMVFVYIDTDEWQEKFFIIQLTIGGLMTAVCGILTTNTFQISEKFPPEYLVACMAGHSACGAASAVIQVICLGMTDLGSQVVAITYFSIGLLFVICTLLGTFGIKHYSYFYKYYFTRAKELKITEEKRESFFKELKNVFGITKWYLLGLYLTGSTTYILEPGVTALIVSENAGHGNKWNDIFFVPVTAFLMFHLFDWIGRESSARIQRPKDGRIIVLIAILRIGLIPLFMYCNLHPRHNLPVLFQSDYIFILLIIILAFTTGYCAISCIYHAGRVTPDTSKHITSSLTLLTLVASILSFSFLNILIIKRL